MAHRALSPASSTLSSATATLTESANRTSTRVLRPCPPSRKLSNPIEIVKSDLRRLYQLQLTGKIEYQTRVYTLTSNQYRDLTSQIEKDRQLNSFVQRSLKISYLGTINELHITASEAHNSAQRHIVRVHDERIEWLKRHGTPAQKAFARTLNHFSKFTVENKDTDPEIRSVFDPDACFVCFTNAAHKIGRFEGIPTPVWETGYSQGIEELLIKYRDMFRITKGNIKLALALDFPYDDPTNKIIRINTFRSLHTWESYDESFDNNDLFEHESKILRDSRGSVRISEITWTLGDYATDRILDKFDLTAEDRSFIFTVSTKPIVKEFDAFRKSFPPGYIFRPQSLTPIRNDDDSERGQWRENPRRSNRILDRN